MRKIVIERIIKMNEKYLNKLGLGDTKDFQRKTMELFTDEFLLDTLEILIRYEEELRAKEYFSKGIML